MGNDPSLCGHVRIECGAGIGCQNVEGGRGNAVSMAQSTVRKDIAVVAVQPEDEAAY